MGLCAVGHLARSRGCSGPPLSSPTGWSSSPPPRPSAAPGAPAALSDPSIFRSGGSPFGTFLNALISLVILARTPFLSLRHGSCCCMHACGPDQIPIAARPRRNDCCPCVCFYFFLGYLHACNYFPPNNWPLRRRARCCHAPPRHLPRGKGKGSLFFTIDSLRGTEWGGGAEAAACAECIAVRTIRSIRLAGSAVRGCPLQCWTASKSSFSISGMRTGKKLHYTHAACAWGV